VKKCLFGFALGVLALTGFAPAAVAQQVQSYSSQSYSSAPVVYSTPSYSYSTPSYSSSTPSYSSSTPSYSYSTPSYSSSTPVYSSSTPVYSSSTPVYSSSTPVYSSSTPVYSSSTPVYSSSTPVYSSSAPSHVQAVQVQGHQVQAHQGHHHRPSCGDVPPSTCGFTIIHTGCDCDEKCTPLDNKCGGEVPSEWIKCPYYEWCKDFKGDVTAPRVVNCIEESFKFGTTCCTFSCCKIEVCVRTHRVERKVTHCEMYCYKNANLQVCKVKKTGLYDVFALGLPGLPKEIVILHDVTAAQVRQQFPNAPVE